jgi:hypothetical protein
MRGESVWLLPGATRDANGDWIEPAPGPVEVTGCAVAPRVNADTDDTDTRGRQGIVVGLTLYAPPGTALTATSRVQVRGETYEVEGLPGDWRNPYTGRAVGISAALRKATG